MFMALIASTMAAVVLLLWSYWLNANQRCLLWIAASFFIASVATFLLGGRGKMPDWLSIDAGVALLLFGISLTWAAMRVFNGRAVKPWVLLIGPVAWAIACRVPAFYDAAGLRVMIGSLMSAAYFAAAAWEIGSTKDGLRTRFAVAAILLLHAGFVLMRAPLILMDQPSQGVFSGAWFGIATLESAIFIQVIAFLMVSMIKERVESQLRAAALTDPLTGIGNRRAFFEASSAVVAHNARHGRSTATIVLDLDRFKDINDRFGHPVGDAVIQAFAAVAKKRLRAADVVGRLGGEEFAVTLSETTSEQASTVAGQLNEAFVAAVSAMAVPGLRCSASAGVSSSPETTVSLKDLLELADCALYEAKRLGGGKVCADFAPGDLKASAAA